MKIPVICFATAILTGVIFGMSLLGGFDVSGVFVMTVGSFVVALNIKKNDTP